MTHPAAKISQLLLIVDDREEVLRALGRLLELSFQRVVLARAADEAERLLAAEQPVFLLCDYWLGEGQPPSTTFLPRWRREHPCLRRVVLMTGTHSASVPACDAVDQIFPKPLRVAGVVDYFRREASTL